MRVLLTRGTMLSLSLGALGAPSSTFLESVPKCPAESVPKCPVARAARNGMFGPSVWSLAVMTLVPKGGESHLGTT